ncbi:helix-turn-helix domain-containing protein [Nonomuraea rosea]|uniref:TetR/AcrR family transcriptional regulator n=1 Tax=Nonomuraea rosea TaxID=638574 RepID=UPI0031EF4BCC
MRSDATRNREAILRATEELLAAHGAEHISLDRVAAAAGVGKGTLFRRFGSRTGLFQELLAERAAALALAIESPGSALGPGAPPEDRLLAFLDELAELAERNLALFAAHERACAEDKYRDPTYLRWHRHVTALIVEAAAGGERQREAAHARPDGPGGGPDGAGDGPDGDGQGDAPDSAGDGLDGAGPDGDRLDAEFAAHALLGSFDADLARHVMADGGVARLKSSVRGLAAALLA